MRYFFSTLLLSLTCFLPAKAQSSKDTLPPYRKYPQLPAFQVLLPDSSRSFNTYNIRKGKPSVLILFSPDCDHCEQLSAMILDSLQAFKEVNLVMATPFPLSQIRTFMARTRLGTVPHLVIGKDASFFFGSFFKAETVPFIAVYDKNKQFVTTVTRLKKIEDLLEILRPLK
jgi:hypothetical protein